MKKLIIALVALSILGLAGYFVYNWYSHRLINNPHFACGNGRIEATELNISARLAGKVEKIMVREGDTVTKDEALVIMQTNVLIAELNKAEANRELAIAAHVQTLAKVSVAEAALVRAEADLKSKLATAAKDQADYLRHKDLVVKDATSQKHFQAAEAAWLTSQADVAAAEASVKETKAALEMAKADVQGAVAAIRSVEAQIASIKADIDDSILRAPLDGRVQYRVVEPGEVLGAGGRAINMVDLTDVYMTFFLPEKTAGKVRIGAEVRIVLDAVPDYPLSAKVTEVDSVAQFTPKTVETQVERQKLMFRIKAHIDRQFLEDFADLVKTGLPGVAWVRLDDSEPWPKELQPTKEAQERIAKMREKMKANRQKERHVIDSKTEDLTRSRIENFDKFSKEAEGASKEKKVDIEVKAARQEAAKKAAAAEKTVQEARDMDAARKKQVEQSVEEAKKMNAPAKTAEPAEPAKAAEPAEPAKDAQGAEK